MRGPTLEKKLEHAKLIAKSGTHVYMPKKQRDEWRERIKRDVAAYLARGGQITVGPAPGELHQ